MKNMEGILMKRGALSMMMVCLLASCASDVGDIDRTDPDKIKKADLKGVWYYVQTVIDAPTPSPITFDGEMAYYPGSVKVLFDIQEDYLVVYPISELAAKGSEKKWTKKSIRNYWDEGKEGEFLEIYVGQPVAMYEIEKHFNVIRRYNAQTGEQSNVLVEDVADEYWYERDYVRVNWARNHVVADVMFMGGAAASEVDYYVQEYEVDNPDAFEMDESAINFVTKIFLAPYPGSEGCSIFGISASDCFGVVAKVRNSFRKADPNNDYVPLFFDEDRWNGRFGYFLTTAYGYDEDHGLQYTDKQYWIQRYNIWKNSRTNEPLIDEATGAPARCLKDEECKALHPDGQVHCWLEDGWFSQGHCVTWDPLPLHVREPKPILYFTSASWPEEFKSSTYVTADSWDKAYTDTVAWSQFWSEKGMYEVRGCKTNADCMAGLAPLVDASYLDTHPVYCNPATEEEDKVCISGIAKSLQEYQKCSAEGQCVAPILCDVNNPCPLDQACLSGVCHTCTAGAGKCDPGSATGWEKVVSKRSKRGAYTLYYLKTADGREVEFRRGIDDEILLEEPEVEYWIALANLNPEVGPVVLRDETGATVCGTANAPMQFTYEAGELFRTPGCNVALPPDKTDPEKKMKSVMRSFKVTDPSGKTVFASFNFAQLEGGNAYTLALIGGAKTSQLLMGKGDLTDISRGGMRLAHAAPGLGPVDFSVLGALNGRAVKFGTFSAYGHLAIEDSRVLVLPTGGRGDVTCYSDHGIGMCTGWSYEMTKEDMARAQAIKESLPFMYLGCENVYTGDACGEDKKDWRKLQFEAARKGETIKLPQNDCRYWYQDENQEWHNPCGEVPGAANVKKHGDVRYSSFYWVGEDNIASPLGYGPSSADEDSGELYYGIAHVYGSDMVGYGHYGKDLYDLITGKLKKDDVMTGKYVRDYLERQGKPAPTESLYAPLVDKNRLQRIAQVAPEIKRFWLTPEEKVEVEAIKKNRALAMKMVDPREVKKTIWENARPGMTEGQLKARADLVKGTWLEDLMINEEVKLIANGGSLAGDTLTPQDYNAISPLTWASHEAVQKERDRQRKLAEYRYTAGELFEPNCYATAIKAQKWCENADNRKESGQEDQDKCQSWWITREMLNGILQHEVGHTIGLRHNFGASTDVFNYMDPYYEIREEEYRTCYLEGENGCVFGDTCKIECEEDKDCMPGTVCTDVTFEGEALRACVDEHMDPTGWCWGTRKQFVDCKSEADCASLGDALCQKSPAETWGHCAVAAKPENKICLPGTAAVNDLCLQSGSCNKGSGKCAVDPNRSCTEDLDCQKVYVVVSDEVYGPIKSFNPRLRHTQSEIEKGRADYQYSSIMDYGGTIDFDMYGLSKYDEAAIRFGYGELIDVYVDTARLYDEMEKVGAWWWNDKYGWSGLYMQTDIFGDFYWHSPFFFLSDFIGVKENLERLFVPYRNVVNERMMVASEDRGLWDLSYRPVPYVAQYDMWAGTMRTYTFDMGVDMGEIVDHSWNKLIEYYVFDAFKRERWGTYRWGNPLTYFTRIMDRWFLPMTDVGRYYAMFLNGWRFYAGLQNIFFKNSNWFGQYRMFARDAFQKLSQLIFSPAPGSYKLVGEGTENERFVNFSFTPGEPGSDLDIQVGDGKFPYTTFYKDAGYYYYEHAAFIGSFWEKIAALYTMTYSIGYFIGDYMGEQVAVGTGSSSGYNDTFYAEMSNMLGGYIIGDQSRYAPYAEFDQDTKSYEFHPFDPLHPWEADGMPRIETGIDTLSMRDFLAWFSYAYIPSGFNTAFLDGFNLCLKGNGNCYSPADEEAFEDGAFDPDLFLVEAIEYSDPWTKKTYLARSTNYGAADESGNYQTTESNSRDRLDASFELVLKANETKEAWEALPDDDPAKDELGKQLNELRDLLDMVLTYNEIYGKLQY
jgi:hypothetical protein